MRRKLYNKIIVITIPIFFLILGFYPNVISNEFNYSEILYVGGSGSGNYSSIQSAINAANSGDIVFVYSGVYFENLLFTKSIILIGEDKNSTIIDGNNYGDVINISYDFVEINSFTIRNCGFEGYPYYDATIDIYSNNNRIVNSIILSNSTYGIHVYESMFNEISNNVISENQYGIYLNKALNNSIDSNKIYSNSLYGVYLNYASGNQISSNNVSSNRNYGIWLLSASNNNMIFKNIISENVKGIRIKGGDSNIVYENIFSNNSEIGLWPCCGSYDNYFFKNSFYSNNQHAEDYYPNQWYYQNIGNFWEDYKDKYPDAVDNNEDGIWDTPYEIDGEINFDLYPLVNPWKNSPPNIPNINGPTDGKIGIGYEYCINGTFDTDNDPVYIMWDWGDGTNTSWLGPYNSDEEICSIHTWTEFGVFIIKAKLKDIYSSESEWGYLEVSIPKNKVRIDNNMFFDWPYYFGILFGNIQDPYVDRENDIDYLHFYANRVYFYALSYGFGGSDIYLDFIPQKNCKFSLGKLREFNGFFNENFIFGRYNGYFP
jgi:parallel beta-helix repeat protein